MNRKQLGYQTMSLGVAGRGVMLEQKAARSLRGKKIQNRRKCLEAKYRWVVQEKLRWQRMNTERERKRSKKGEFMEAKVEGEEEKEKSSVDREAIFLL